MSVKRGIMVTIFLFVGGIASIIIGEEIIYQDIGYVFVIIGGAMIAFAAVIALFIALYHFYPPDPPLSYGGG